VFASVSVKCLLYISCKPVFLVFICNSIKSELALITCTVTRMIQSEVSFQVAHFSLEHTLVIICGSIWRTYGLFVWWTVIHTNTPRIPGSKRLANSEVVTGDVDTWIKSCEKNIYRICNFFGCWPVFFLILQFSWPLGSPLKPLKKDNFFGKYVTVNYCFSYIFLPH